MTPRSTIAGAPWLAAPETLALIAALDKDAGVLPAIRFVGGCVRNALMKLPVEDIDLATVHAPEKVMKLAEASGFSPVGTGLLHGTVTVVVKGKPFEVTTLRVDVATDGRRAQVQYTEDWAADASRRDFTINAIYADADGKLFDPVGGVKDIAARRVRFIGDAHGRIREDFLRILRFFRFHAWYGEGALDPVGVEACRSEREGLKKLSAERVQKELLKLLEARDPLATLEAMIGAGILQIILPEAGDLRLLAQLIAVEASLGLSDPVRRLAALTKTHSDAGALATRLRLSNEMRARLMRLRTVLDGAPLEAGIEGKALRRLLYAEGAESITDRIVLAWASKNAGAEAWRKLLESAQSYKRPSLPFDGRDAMGFGLSGEKVGALIKAVEDWWIDQDFKPGREAVLARARRIVDES